MTSRPNAGQVRQLVARTLAELAEDAGAVWLIDEGILKFFDAQGNALRIVNLREEILPQEMAA